METNDNSELEFVTSLLSKMTLEINLKEEPAKLYESLGQYVTSILETLNIAFSESSPVQKFRLECFQYHIFHYLAETIHILKNRCGYQLIGQKELPWESLQLSLMRLMRPLNISRQLNSLDQRAYKAAMCNSTSDLSRWAVTKFFADKVNKTRQSFVRNQEYQRRSHLQDLEDFREECERRTNPGVVDTKAINIGKLDCAQMKAETVDSETMKSKMSASRDMKIEMTNKKYEYEILRDIVSLERILKYLNVGKSVNLESNPELAILAIERVLQVIGEYLKQTTCTQHLSEDTQIKIIKEGVPVKELSTLRDMLSHSNSLLIQKRKMSGGPDSQISLYREIKHDLEKLRRIIKDILHKTRLNDLEILCSRNLEPSRLKSYLAEEIPKIQDLNDLTTLLDSKVISHNFGRQPEHVENILDEISGRIQMADIQEQIQIFEVGIRNIGHISGTDIDYLHRIFKEETAHVIDISEKSSTEPSLSGIQKLNLQLDLKESWQNQVSDGNVSSQIESTAIPSIYIQLLGFILAINLDKVSTLLTLCNENEQLMEPDDTGLMTAISEALEREFSFKAINCNQNIARSKIRTDMFVTLEMFRLSGNQILNGSASSADWKYFIKLLNDIFVQPLSERNPIVSEIISIFKRNFAPGESILFLKSKLDFFHSNYEVDKFIVVNIQETIARTQEYIKKYYSENDLRDLEHLANELENKRELHYSKLTLINLLQQKESRDNFWVTQCQDCIGSLTSLGVDPNKLGDILSTQTKKSSQASLRFAQSIKDPYANYLRTMKSKKTVKEMVKAFESLTNLIANNNSPALLQLRAKFKEIQTVQLENYFEDRLSQLENLVFSGGKNTIVEIEQLYIKSPPFQSAVEMLVLDLSDTLKNITESAGRPELEVILTNLGNLSPNLQSHFPVRNYLAHGDFVLDLLSPTLVQGIISNAQNFIEFGPTVLMIKRILDNEDLRNEIQHCVILENYDSLKILGESVPLVRRFMESPGWKDIISSLFLSTPSNASHETMEPQMCLDQSIFSRFKNFTSQVFREEAILAAQWNDLAKLKFCERAGVVLDTKFELDWTLLHYSTRGTLSDLTLEDTGSIFSYLYQLFNTFDIFGANPVHFAAQFGHDLLFGSEFDLELLSSTIISPLVLSTSENHTFISQYLIKRKSQIDLNMASMDDWTALRLATRVGNYDLAHDLLISGVQVDTPLKRRSPVHDAVQYNQLKILRLLLSFNANPNATNEFRTGITPLYLAVVEGNVEAMKILIASGADLNARSMYNRHLQFFAAMKGKTEVVKFFCEHQDKFDINIGDQDGRSQLHTAASNGYPDIIGILLSVGANPDILDSNGLTPLHLAVLKNHVDIVKCLLEGGADPNIISGPVHQEQLPIDFAVGGDHIEIVKVLFPLLQFKENWRPLHLCRSLAMLEFLLDICKLDIKDSPQNLLHLACALNSEDIVKFVVGKKFYDINSGDDDTKNKWTPLHHKVSPRMNSRQRSKVPLLKYLITNGAMTDIKDNQGRNCLDLALERMQWDCASYLLRTKARPIKEDFRHLNLAIESGSIGLVKYLVEADALMIPRFGARTPLQVAAKAKQWRIMKYLVEQGASIWTSADMQAPTFWAASNGDLDNVRFLIGRGSSVSAVDEEGHTILHVAAESSNGFDVVHYLLEEIDGIDINLPTLKSKSTPILLAAKSGSLKTLKYLVNKGADYKGVQHNDNNLLSLSLKSGDMGKVKYCESIGCTSLPASVLTPALKISSCFNHELSSPAIETYLVDNLAKLMAPNELSRVDLTEIAHVAAKYEKWFTIVFNGLVPELVDVNSCVTTQTLDTAGRLRENPATLLEIYLSRKVDNTKILERLLNLGARYNYRVKIEQGLTEKEIWRPFFNLVQMGNIQQLKNIFESDPSLVNAAGGSILRYCARLGLRNFVEYLVEDKAVPVDSEDKEEGTTPLMSAARGKHLFLVKYFVNKGCNVNHLNKSGWSVFLLAASLGSLDILKYLFKLGVNSGVTVPLGYDRTRWGCLHLAVEFLMWDVVPFLAEEVGANVDSPNGEWWPIQSAVENNKVGVVKILVSRGADPTIINECGQSLLHLSDFADVDNERASLETFKYMVNSLHLDLNLTDKENKMTSLHYAARRGSLEKVKTLLGAGAEANLVDALGRTPLHWVAAKSDSVELFNALKKHCKDINLKDSAGNSIIDLVRQNDRINVRGRGGGSLKMPEPTTRTIPNLKAELEKAIWNLDIDKVKEYLSRGADPNSKNLTLNPLIYVVSRNRIDIVKCLLEIGGMDVNSRTANGTTTLHTAVSCGSLDMARALIQAGADVNARNDAGALALHMAVSDAQNFDLVRYLLDCGSDVNVRNAFRQRPIDIAIGRDVADIYQLLKSKEYTDP